MTAGPAKGQPQRIWHRGQEFVSILGAAQMLGVSVSTVRRLEARGVLARPGSLGRGNRGTRWYRVEDLAVATEGGGSYTVMHEAVPAHEVERRSWRDILRRRGEEDDWSPPEQPRRLEASLCPGCGRELLWATETNPNGQGEQVPQCEHCGVVDLRQPEPEEGTCVHCGAEVIWEMDQQATGGFSPVCERCGVTQVYTKPKPERRQGSVSFLPPPIPEERRRPRGLYEGFFPGAVRKPRTAPAAGFEVPLDPYGGPQQPR